MTNPTDTNQASEIAEQIIQDFRKWHDGPWDYNGDDPRQKGAKTIQELIRTEKLKLLAEVRERVVGEDERIDIQSEFDKIDVPHLETDKYPGLDGVRQASRNIYRNHQRVELAKLEAEL